MSENYTPSNFDEFADDSTRRALASLGDFIGWLARSFYKFNFVLMAFGAVLNIFHLLVLTRKSMNNNSINLVMIGIAISDIIYMGVLIYQHVTVFQLEGVPYECLPPYSYYALYAFYCVAALKDVVRRLSSWLSALMAFLRFLIIKNALNRKYNFLSKNIFGLKVIILELVLTTVMSLFYLTRVTLIDSGKVWTPGDQCGFPMNYSTPEFEFVDRDIFYSGPQTFEVFVIIEGFMKINTALFLPLCAFLLIRELRKAEESRRKVSVAIRKKSDETKTDNTSKLVIIMTITSIVAEGPFGIMVVVQGIANGHTGLLAIINDVISILLVFVILNATTHCFVCLGVSSQYRKTVKEIFSGKKIVRTATVTPPKASVTSITTVRQVNARIVD